MADIFFVIQHERNRSVTFAKRKHGLFKKAFELGVLCSVEVAVIIFEERPGNHVKLYQYGSSDIDSIVQRHLHHDGERDSHGTADFRAVAGRKLEGVDIDEFDYEPVRPISHAYDCPPNPSASMIHHQQDQQEHFLPQHQHEPQQRRDLYTGDRGFLEVQSGRSLLGEVSPSQPRLGSYMHSAPGSQRHPSLYQNYTGSTQYQNQSCRNPRYYTRAPQSLSPISHQPLSPDQGRSCHQIPRTRSTSGASGSESVYASFDSNYRGMVDNVMARREASKDSVFLAPDTGNKARQDESSTSSTPNVERLEVEWPPLKVEQQSSQLGPDGRAVRDIASAPVRTANASGQTGGGVHWLDLLVGAAKSSTDTDIAIATGGVDAPTRRVGWNMKGSLESRGNASARGEGMAIDELAMFDLHRVSRRG